MVIFTYLFGHLVFYLFGPLGSVNWTSSSGIQIIALHIVSRQMLRIANLRNSEQSCCRPGSNHGGLEALTNSAGE